LLRSYLIAHDFRQQIQILLTFFLTIFSEVRALRALTLNSINRLLIYVLLVYVKRTN